MNLKIYAIRDRATDQFLNPMFFINNGQALRSFGDEVNNRESALHKHPSDYDLYELGSYETETGTFETHTPKQIGIGKDFIDNNT